MPRKPSRTVRALTTLLGALGGVLALTAATLTSPVYSGTGWKALTTEGIYSLSPDPYEIVFADTTARTRLAKYFLLPAAQVTRSVGVPITVTTTLDLTPLGTCPPRHRIVVHYLHQPLGQPGMSQARPCYATGNGSAWGGHILMDSEYWTIPTWFGPDPAVNEARRKDASTHELGHILGLDHPNTDIDRDGTVEAGECVAKDWLKPVMCSPNRGLPWPTVEETTGPVAYNFTEPGKFSKDFDLPGLRQLLANYVLRQG
ncbi:hypothetical protein [Streptomyces violaceorubidus]|uniref:hypothetical protein n=1 Tax=Streptomyces violaceorubidus TaxID=284042 RepID=UPI00068DE42E|nr:hypothetical protein [Streptomyces violaceorubidus]